MDVHDEYLLRSFTHPEGFVRLTISAGLAAGPDITLRELLELVNKKWLIFRDKRLNDQ